MGRKLMRVTLDFDWPQNIVWKGYLNPYSPTKCDACDGTSYNKETKKISDTWYDFKNTGRGWCHNITQDEVQALVDRGRLMDFTHTPRTPEQVEIVKKKIADGGNSWLPEPNGYIPTAKEVNEWSTHFIGHDAINRWICIEARAKRLGVWGHCSLCNGRGEYFCEDKYVKLHEAWEPIEPPTGDGFQLWETTSEGSPASPVFVSLDELCEWCAINASTFADNKATKDEWMKMLNENSVCHKEGNNIFI